MDHLKTKLKIENDKKWSYIVRQEQTISGQINTIVFLELYFTPDIYLHKLHMTYNDRTIVPSIHSWSDKEFLLRYILTFYGTMDINSEFLTNLSQSEIEEKAIIIKPTSSLENVKHENISLNKSISLDEKIVLEPAAMVKTVKVLPEEEEMKDGKPLIKCKQIEKFNNFYSSFNSIVESSSQDTGETLKELERCVRNMVNYRSSYSIPEEMQVQIKECQEKLKVFKKNP